MRNTLLVWIISLLFQIICRLVWTKCRLVWIKHLFVKRRILRLVLETFISCEARSTLLRHKIEKRGRVLRCWTLPRVKVSRILGICMKSEVLQLYDFYLACFINGKGGRISFFGEGYRTCVTDDFSFLGLIKLWNVGCPKKRASKSRCVVFSGL